MSRALSLVLAAALLPAALLPARGQDTTQRGVRIGLTYQSGVKPGVMVLPIAGTWGDSIRTILQRDFDYGDRIAVVGTDSVADGGIAAASAGRFNYPLFARLGVAAIVVATATPTGLHVALHDVGAARVASVKDFVLPAGAPGHEWRTAVHGIADEVEQWITGVRGIAQTRVAFVRGNRVYVVDSDGAFERAVTSGGLALSPAWHPSGRYLAYSSVNDVGSRIMLLDLATSYARVVSGATGGLNITPVFSPDGGTLVYAHGEDEGTDLYAVSPFQPGAPRQVTVGRGTDNVSPSFSPDGRRIAFTSGRSGHPEVYIMDSDGTNAELLTPFAFGDQYYRSNPDWSPDGRVIAFQSQIAGIFQVMTISLRDRSIKQLTSEGRNEEPSWAPDGRHLVFTSNRTGERQLWVLDVESGRLRQLTHGGGGRLAAWSPRLERVQ